jgi:enoyl-CoA hydratase
MTMPYETITFEITDSVAFVTVNRPDKLNALNAQVVTELGQAADEIAKRDDIAGAIITGAGPKAFVAGADIGELAPLTPLEAQAVAKKGQIMCRKIETCGKPVVAAVNGFALGGGCELAMSCHVRIASEKAKFGQPEVKLGLIPGYGGTQRLPRLVGKGRALEMIISGRMVGADEALQMGLVSKVVPPEEVMAEAETMLRGILSMGPLAVRMAIEAVDQGYDMTLKDGFKLEANLFGLVAASEDKAEGTNAFLEKREPDFKGK